MPNNRRDFIKLIGAVAAGSSFAPNIVFGSKEEKIKKEAVPATASPKPNIDIKQEPLIFEYLNKPFKYEDYQVQDFLHNDLFEKVHMSNGCLWEFPVDLINSNEMTTTSIYVDKMRDTVVVAKNADYIRLHKFDFEESINIKMFSSRQELENKFEQVVNRYQQKLAAHAWRCVNVALAQSSEVLNITHAGETEAIEALKIANRRNGLSVHDRFRNPPIRKFYTSPSLFRKFTTDTTVKEIQYRGVKIRRIDEFELYYGKKKKIGFSMNKRDDFVNPSQGDPTLLIDSRIQDPEITLFGEESFAIINARNMIKVIDES